MTSLSINVPAMVQVLAELLNTPSPTGYHREIIPLVQSQLEALAIPGARLQHLPKGALLYHIPGRANDAPRGLTAHVDTLGLMVKEIKANGRIRPAKIGGFMWNAVEFEGVTLRTWEDQRFRGVCQPVNPSTHVNSDLPDMKRGDKNMEIRLDSRAESAEAIRQLGIEIGDFIFLDVRLEVNDEGFIRARHLDDKAGLAAILGALAALQEAGLQPAQDTTLLISNYEEIGHGGGTGWPDNLAELLVIDMAAIGEGQHSDIYSVNICAKDNSSVYHLDMLDRLRRLAKEHHIPAKLDLYPHYGSDGGAYWRTGGTAKVALIGPGVEASHAYERTHQDSLHDTAHLIACYLVDDTP